MEMKTDADLIWPDKAEEIDVLLSSHSVKQEPNAGSDTKWWIIVVGEKEERWSKTAEFVKCSSAAVMFAEGEQKGCCGFVYHQLGPNNLVTRAAFSLVAPCLPQSGGVMVFFFLLLAPSSLFISLCLRTVGSSRHAPRLFKLQSTSPSAFSCSAHHKHKIRLRCQTPAVFSVHYWFPVILHPLCAVPSPTRSGKTVSLFVRFI